MNNKGLIGIFISCLMFMTGNAQSYQKTDLGIKTAINSIGIKIQFYSPSTVRVIEWPEGKKFTKESLSVIKTPQKTAFSIKQQGEELVVKSDNLQTVLNLKTGKVSISTPSGSPLLNEKESGVTFTDFNDAGVKTYSVFQSFVLVKDEAIYGLGQQQNGKIVQRNLKLNMVQGNTDDYIPFFQSVKGYGLFWDNYSPTLFVDGPEGTSFKSDVGDCIDYYFMYGGNADGVIEHMRDLTGQVTMFPLWTFGYWQSKERYKSQKELKTIGALMDFKTWPQSGSEKWPPNLDYPSGVKVYDPYNPETRDIYWKYLNKGLLSFGIDGWWMDSSEPDHLDFKPSDFDNKTYLGSFRKVRNSFPLLTVGGVSQHQRSVFSDKRVFILTRSAFAGQQRYGANTWSGEKAINLRYSLLPYIYSLSWDVTANQFTMMRALVMDFPKDKQALDINDQYMFGRSLLVCPVTNPMYSKDKKEDFSTVKAKELYLPKGADWYDF